MNYVLRGPEHTFEAISLNERKYDAGLRMSCAASGRRWSKMMIRHQNFLDTTLSDADITQWRSLEIPMIGIRIDERHSSTEARPEKGITQINWLAGTAMR